MKILDPLNKLAHISDRVKAALAESDEFFQERSAARAPMCM